MGRFGYFTCHRGVCCTHRRGVRVVLIIKEVSDLNSDRDGTKFNGTLNQAKSYATSTRMFKGTVLKIENEIGVLLAYKLPLCRWMDAI